MMSLKSFFDRIRGFRVPTTGSAFKVYLLGVVNFVFFGWGTLASGFIDGCPEDIFIGVLQFLLPVVGWIWSVVWGFLMLSRKYKQSKLEGDSMPTSVETV